MGVGTGNAPGSRESGVLAKRDKTEVQRAWLTAYAETAVLSAASRRVRVSPTTFRQWRRESQENPEQHLVRWPDEDSELVPFHEAVETALEVAVDRIEEEVLARAVEGVEEPLTYQGRKTGDSIRRRSDLLLMFALKKFRPAYRENHKVEVEHTGVVEITDSSRARLAEKLSAALERIAQTPPPNAIDGEVIESAALPAKHEEES